MKMPQLLILLLTILLQAAAAFPALSAQNKYASWDDVNVVAHGLLQLGQGLKEHVDKTKAQMRDIVAKLKTFNSTVAELERRQWEQGEALQARFRELEEKERALEKLAEEVKVKVEEVRKQREDVHARVEKLEERVDGVQVADGNNSDHTGVPLLQVRGETFSITTDDTVRVLRRICIQSNMQSH